MSCPVQFNQGWYLCDRAPPCRVESPPPRETQIFWQEQDLTPHLWEILLASSLPFSSRWFLLPLGLQLPQPSLVYSNRDLLMERQLLLHHRVAKRAKHDVVASRLVPRVGRRRPDLAGRMVSGPSPASFRYKTERGLPRTYSLSGSHASGGAWWRCDRACGGDWVEPWPWRETHPRVSRGGDLFPESHVS